MNAALPAAVDDIRDQITSAAARGVALRIVGSGTWLDAGRAVRDAETLETRGLTGVTQYVPGDLTLTARGGTTLAEIGEATRANGQWLALDPFGGDAGTIGATVATASAGPLRASFGSPRDLVLGLELVTGEGVVARGGGRVVKNVAGFDISRLLTGSWGTLGVITEVTLRLHARPEADQSLAIPILDDAPSDLNAHAGVASQVLRTRQLLRQLPFTPYACEILNTALAHHVLGTNQPVALFRLGGNREGVAAQRAALEALGAAREVGHDVWLRLRECEPPASMVIRLSALPADIARTWTCGARIAAVCSGTLIHAAPYRGVVRCIVPSGPSQAAALRSALAGMSDATRIGERLPADLWPACGPSAVSDRVSAGIKRAFDVHGLLNPGILGGAA